jgi:hypothetical protein
MLDAWRLSQVSPEPRYKPRHECEHANSDAGVALTASDIATHPVHTKRGERPILRSARLGSTGPTTRGSRVRPPANCS